MSISKREADKLAALHERFGGTLRGVRFNVAPRYTAGSPAQVPLDTALHVAIEEENARKRNLEGIYGRQLLLEAEERGLGEIVEARRERRGHWQVLDLCTGEWHERPFPARWR